MGGPKTTPLNTPTSYINTASCTCLIEQLLQDFFQISCFYISVPNACFQVPLNAYISRVFHSRHGDLVANTQIGDSYPPLHPPPPLACLPACLAADSAPRLPQDLGGPSQRNAAKFPPATQLARPSPSRHATVAEAYWLAS